MERRSGRCVVDNFDQFDDFFSIADFASLFLSRFWLSDRRRLNWQWQGLLDDDFRSSHARCQTVRHGSPHNLLRQRRFEPRSTVPIGFR
jgi:hypothetical protein